MRVVGLPGGFPAPAVEVVAAKVQPPTGALLGAGQAALGAQAVQRVARDAEIGGGAACVEPAIHPTGLRGSAA